MDLAVVEGHHAFGYGTGVVSSFECSPLSCGGQAFGPAHIEWDPVSVQNHRNDVCIAGQTTNGADGKICSEHRAVRGIGPQAGR